MKRQHGQRARQGRATSRVAATAPAVSKAISRRRSSLSSPARKSNWAASTTSSNKMPVKKYRPTSPGRRFVTTMDFSDLSKVDPQRRLSKFVRSIPAATTTGTSPCAIGRRHAQAVSHHRLQAPKDGDSGARSRRSSTIRTAPRIALLHYKDGEKRYILAPLGLKVGDVVESGPSAPTSRSATASDQEHSGWYRDSQHRVASRTRRQARAFGRCRRN
jgi:hypothetical protein